MPAEIKAGKVKMDFALSASLRKKFHRRCKKLNVSAAQRLRDLVQQDSRGQR